MYNPRYILYHFDLFPQFCAGYRLCRLKLFEKEAASLSIESCLRATEFVFVVLVSIRVVATEHQKFPRTSRH